MYDHLNASQAQPQASSKEMNTPKDTPVSTTDVGHVSLTINSIGDPPPLFTQHPSLLSTKTLSELQSKFHLIDNQLYTKLTEYNRMVVACSNSFKSGGYLKTTPAVHTSKSKHSISQPVVKNTLYWESVNKKSYESSNELLMELSSLLETLEISVSSNPTSSPSSDKLKEQQIRTVFLTRVRKSYRDHAKNLRDAEVLFKKVLVKMKLLDVAPSAATSKFRNHGEDEDGDGDGEGEAFDDDQREHVRLLDRQQAGLSMSLRTVTSLIDEALLSKANLLRQNSMLGSLRDRMSTLMTSYFPALSNTFRGIDYYQFRERIILSGTIAICMFIIFLYLAWK